jgi:hypothetical protein
VLKGTESSKEADKDDKFETDALAIIIHFMLTVQRI